MGWIRKRRNKWTWVGNRSSTGGIGGLLLAGAIGFVGGASGSILNQLISYGDFQVKPALLSGLMSAGINMVACLGIAASGLAEIGLKILPGEVAFTWMQLFTGAIGPSVGGAVLSVYLETFLVPGYSRDQQKGKSIIPVNNKAVSFK